MNTEENTKSNPQASKGDTSVKDENFEMPPVDFNLFIV